MYLMILVAPLAVFGFLVALLKTEMFMLANM